MVEPRSAETDVTGFHMDHSNRDHYDIIICFAYHDHYKLLCFDDAV